MSKLFFIFAICVLLSRLMCFQSENFPFLGTNSTLVDLKCRTAFYASLARLLSTELAEDEDKLDEFMRPIGGKLLYGGGETKSVSKTSANFLISVHFQLLFALRMINFFQLLLVTTSCFCVRHESWKSVVFKFFYSFYLFISFKSPVNMKLKLIFKMNIEIQVGKIKK